MELQSLPLEILFFENECSSIIYKFFGNPKKNLKQICTKQSNNTKVKKKKSKMNKIKQGNKISGAKWD